MSLSACLFFIGCASETDSPPADGDTDGDADLDADTDESTGQCENGTLGCSGTVAIICKDGKWTDLSDCAIVEKICEKGLCVEAPLDGDLDTDLDNDPDIEREDPPDTTPPEIASTSPANDATGIDPNIGKIRMNFNEPISTRIFVLARDIVISGGCKKITFTGSVSNDRLQIELSLLDSLESGEIYTIDMAADTLSDEAGNAFAGYTFSFTVSGDLDGDCETDLDAAPFIESSYPYDGQAGVALDVHYIQVFFSERMRITGYDEAHDIHVTGDDNHQVPFTAEWLQDNTHLSLTLDEDLHIDTDYTVLLDEGLRDNDDNPLGSASFTFSTRAETEDGDATDGDVQEQDITDGDTDAPPPNTGQIVNDNKGICLPDVDGDAAEPMGHLETAWMASSIGASAAKLRVYHRNAAYDRNLQSLTAILEQDGHSLVLRETAVIASPADETCLRDASYDIDYLVPTHYTVTLWPDGAESPLTLNVNAPEK
jgi:hypothetical protein